MSVKINNTTAKNSERKVYLCTWRWGEQLWR